MSKNGKAVTAVSITEKQQARLDQQAQRVLAARQNLVRLQTQLEQAQREQVTQEARLIGMVEEMLGDRDLNLEHYQWEWAAPHARIVARPPQASVNLAP